MEKAKVNSELIEVNTANRPFFMNVLIACEYSGIVREAFARKGHNAWSCDLLASEKPGQHFQEDIFSLLQRLPAGYFDFIGLHYPCTGVALCGNRYYGKGCPKHSERIEAIENTRRIWDLCKSKAVMCYYENPKNVMSKFIGKRTQAIQPYQFGHMEQKETWLWLHNLPPLLETNNVYEVMMQLPRKERERIFHMTPSPLRGYERSRTCTGIAAAMADQWGPIGELKLFA